jgi:hypothetical protein
MNSENILKILRMKRLSVQWYFREIDSENILKILRMKRLSLQWYFREIDSKKYTKNIKSKETGHLEFEGFMMEIYVFNL